MGFSKAVKESTTSAVSVQNVSSVVDLPLDEEDHPSSPEKAHDSANSTSNSPEKLLTSLLFAIPLPLPAQDYSSAHDALRPVLLYTLPRSVYEKPPKDPLTNKRPKEKISKKISRSWNKSIQDGEDIKRGDYASPTLMKKCLGALFRWTAASLRFITTCDNQMLDRLPPITKLGQVQIVCLGDPTSFVELDAAQRCKPAMLPEEVAEKTLVHNLSQTKKETTFRILLSGFILPLALAAEIFVPLVFEISLIYFLVQYKGWKKVKFLLNQYTKEREPLPWISNNLETGNNEIKKPTCGIFKFKVIESEISHQIQKLTYSTCSEVNPRKFPDRQEATFKSLDLIKRNEVIEMTTILPFQTDPESLICADVKKDVSARDLHADTEPTQIPSVKEAITFRLPYNDRSTVTLHTAQTNDKNTQATGVTEEFARNPLQEGTPAHVPGVLQSDAPADKACILRVSQADAHSKVNETPNETPTGQETYFCSTAAPVKEDNPEIAFASTPPKLDEKIQVKPIANKEIVADLIKLFRESLPPDVVSRHELNERRVAEDFNRALKRRIKAYVKSVKKPA